MSISRVKRCVEAMNEAQRCLNKAQQLADQLAAREAALQDIRRRLRDAVENSDLSTITALEDEEEQVASILQSSVQALDSLTKLKAQVDSHRVAAVEEASKLADRVGLRGTQQEDAVQRLISLCLKEN